MRIEPVRVSWQSVIKGKANRYKKNLGTLEVLFMCLNYNLAWYQLISWTLRLVSVRSKLPRFGRRVVPTGKTGWEDGLDGLCRSLGLREHANHILRSKEAERTI